MGVPGFNDTPGFMPCDLILCISSFQSSIHKNHFKKVDNKILYKGSLNKMHMRKTNQRKYKDKLFDVSTWNVKPEAPAFAKGST